MKLHSTLSVLSALAGFAAGALLIGILALEQPPTSRAAESPRPVASSSAVRDAPHLELMSTQAPDRLAVAGPWPFETATTSAAPGRARPDRLSAPEGWTY